MRNVPILLTTYNRLEFTKKALETLMKGRHADIYIIDNNSTDGTQDFLLNIIDFIDPDAHKIVEIYINHENHGVSGAMNQFMEFTKNYEFICKCDNDTILPADFIEKMLPHMEHADLVQARHPILKETHPGGFDEWVKKMPQKGELRFNAFIGGSGILCRRSVITKIPDTDSKIMGWRQWQRDNPKILKAFATDVSVKLLDTDENGSAYPPEFSEYYRETGRNI